MRFADLPIRISHDISGFRQEQISGLIGHLTPFIRFCREDGRLELEALLCRIEVRLKEGLAEGHFQPELYEGVARLTGEISRLNLEGVEPGFLAQGITVFALLKPQPGKTHLTIALQSPLIQDVLVLLLKQKYGLVRDYSREYRMKDLLELESLILICNAALACRVAENGLSRDRIVCMDFKSPAEQGFRKTLIFPFLVQDLDGIF